MTSSTLTANRVWCQRNNHLEGSKYIPADNNLTDESKVYKPPFMKQQSDPRAKKEPERIERLPQHSSTKREAGQAPSADLTTEPSSELARVDTGPPYSVFKPWQKKLIVFSASFGAVFSPMSTTIYLPALNSIASDLNVSNAEINLTVTTFLIMQGLTPTLIAGFSDAAGRRPAYMMCYTIYLAANLGLALQTNYAALMVLRCLQSAGSSGTVALAQGVVADVATSSERGIYVGLASVTSIVGPILGPIIGGVISQYAGWHWIFWFLLILCAAYFVPFLLFFPETCRKVVGDGSIYPPLLNRDLTCVMRERYRIQQGVPVNETVRAEVAKNYSLRVPNPLSTLVIVADKESALILLCGGLVVACLYAVTTGVPSQFGSIYGFDEIRIGLVFIPFGAGSIISAFTTGKLIDWNWRRLAKKSGFPVKKNRYQDLTNFPVEKARLQICMPLLYLSCVCMIIYGWILRFRTNLAGPLIILFFIGYGIIAAFQIMQILMVDLNPGHAAASTAANNLFRCLLGAGSTAVVVPMIEKMSVGWTYTFAALVWTLFSPLLIWMIWIGPKWRREKKVKVEKKEQALKNADAENVDTFEQGTSRLSKQSTSDATNGAADEQNSPDREQDKSALQEAASSALKEPAIAPAAVEKSDR